MVGIILAICDTVAKRRSVVDHSGDGIDMHRLAYYRLYMGELPVVLLKTGPANQGRGVPYMQSPPNNGRS